jgi:HSP20 family protein
MANVIRRQEGEENGTTSAAQRAPSGWDPFRVMRELLGWDPFRVPAIGGWAGGFAPGFELTEKDDAYELRADLPGVREEDVDISLQGDRLTISGHREQGQTETRGQLRTSERSFGSFSRSFTLPAGADREQIDAEMENGVLYVTLAKRPELQAKRIAVSKRVGGRKSSKTSS